ncbi:unnamed protein product [Schistosoma rodhaini]|nr:unnamed protein product [Schistosoma rodhaini]
MEKAVSLFTNPDFSIKELINSLYLDTLMIRQCFQGTFILLNNNYNNESDHTSTTYPTNLFILRDNHHINVSSLLTSNSGSITSWTYSPFYINNNIDWLPHFIIHQTPLLIHIPKSSINPSNMAVRWLICFRLSIMINKRTNSKAQFIVSLHPHVIHSLTSSTSWFSPKIMIDLQKFPSNQQINLNLFAYTSDNLFFNNDDHINNNNNDHITIHLSIHIVHGSSSCILHLFHPFIISLYNLIYNYYNIQNYFSLISTINHTINWFPLCIYRFYKQWIITKGLVTTQQQLLMINQLELKLNKLCIWNIYKLNKYLLLYLITNGIFKGICIYVNMNYTISNQLMIEIRSNSHTLLHLLDQVLFTRKYIDDFHFIPYNQSIENDTKLINNKTFNIEKSITDTLNCLINETEYLIHQITQLIEYTMNKRIPELPVFFKDLTNHLDIAYRSTEWRSIVHKASTIPVDNILPSMEYTQLRLKTDVSFKNLCFVNISDEH